VPLVARFVVPALVLLPYVELGLPIDTVVLVPYEIPVVPLLDMISGCTTSVIVVSVCFSSVVVNSGLVSEIINESLYQFGET
jgi:hypothetical protein